MHHIFESCWLKKKSIPDTLRWPHPWNSRAVTEPGRVRAAESTLCSCPGPVLLRGGWASVGHCSRVCATFPPRVTLRSEQDPQAQDECPRRHQQENQAEREASTEENPLDGAENKIHQLTRAPDKTSVKDKPANNKCHRCVIHWHLFPTRLSPNCVILGGVLPTFPREPRNLPHSNDSEPPDDKCQTATS